MVNRLVFILGVAIWMLVNSGCQRKISKTRVGKDYTNSYNKDIKYIKSAFTLSYKTTDKSGKVKGNIAIIKDSLFFMNVVSPLGNEIARLFMENNDLLFINRLNRTYIDTSVAYFHTFVQGVNFMTMMESIFAGIIDQDEWNIHEMKEKNDCIQLILDGKDEIDDVIIHLNDCSSEKVILKVMHEDLLSRVQLENNVEYNLYLPVSVILELYKLDTKLVFEMEKQKINEKFEILKTIPNRYQRAEDLF